MRFLLVVALAALVNGCVSGRPADQATIQKLGEQCQAYGFKPGTAQFASCIQQMDQSRIADARTKRMAVAAAFSRAGAGMQSRPMNCTSTAGIGGMVRTNCY